MAEITLPADAQILVDGRAMRALWDIVWHTGRGAVLRIAGTHVNYEVVEVGGRRFEGEWSDIVPQLEAWAAELRTA